MTPVPVHVGNCHRCGAAVYLGQTWCHRCFTSVVPVVSPEIAAPPSDSAFTGDSAASSTADGALGASAPPSVPTPAGNGARGGDEPAPEADTATWKSVHLVSETWDLAEGEGEATAYPMTRMEIRLARTSIRRKGRKRRIFRRFMLTMTTLVVLAGLGAGGYLFWQRNIELTPARYATQVRSTVDSADQTIQSIQTLVAQVALSEVPTASQVLQARSAGRSFAICTHRLSRIAAPSSRRGARSELIAGCRNYSSLMSDITAVGGSQVLVDMGAFDSDLARANASWSEGTAKANLTTVTVPIPTP